MGLQEVDNSKHSQPAEENRQGIKKSYLYNNDLAPVPEEERTWTFWNISLGMSVVGGKADFDFGWLDVCL